MSRQAALLKEPSVPSPKAIDFVDAERFAENYSRTRPLVEKAQKYGQIAKISIYKCVSVHYVWLFLGYLLAILAIWLFQNSNSQEIAKTILLFVSFL